MFKFVEEIPVTFEPHWADERMLWLTAGSIAVSGVLGWLAYWNGRKAGRIAKAASTRDEEHRNREARQREVDKRAEVSLAMLRALAATEMFIDQRPTKWGDSDPFNAQEMTRLRNEAVARVHLYAVNNEEHQLRMWLEMKLAELLQYKDPDKPERGRVFQIVNDIRNGINLWNARRVTGAQLFFGDIPSYDPAIPD